MIAAFPPPARCPSCGAAVAGTLLADPDTPWYACGSTPSTIRCGGPILPPYAIENVEAVYGDVLAELRALFLELAPTATSPTITLCGDAGCDGIAIGGVCDREPSR